MTRSSPSSPAATRIAWISDTVRSAWRSGNRSTASSVSDHSTAGRPAPAAALGEERTRPCSWRSASCCLTASVVRPNRAASSGPVAGCRFSASTIRRLAEESPSAVTTTSRYFTSLCLTNGGWWADDDGHGVPCRPPRRAPDGGPPADEGGPPSRRGVLGRGPGLGDRGPLPPHGASRCTGAPSSPGWSPATGTTPASTCRRAAPSTPGPTTHRAYDVDVRRRRGLRPGPPRRRRQVAALRPARGRPRGPDLTLVIAKSVLGLLDARRPGGRHRRRRCPVRRPVSASRAGGRA